MQNLTNLSTKTLTSAQITTIVAVHTNNAKNSASVQLACANNIKKMLSSNSATFANVTTCTTVKLASAKNNKLVSANLQILKISNANITLNANYTNSVNKSANITNFVANKSANNTTTYNNCLKHNINTNNYLLQVTYNKVFNSVYINAQTQQILTKQQVATYLTASAAKKLLAVQTNVTHNITNNVTHNVVLRTIALNNVITLCANKHTLTAQNVISNS